MAGLDWSQVRLLAFDCDGVLTDGRVIVASDGVESAVFNHRDGQGIELVRRAGIPAVMISSQRSDYVVARGNKMQIDFFRGEKNKLERLKQYLEERGDGITLDQVCFVGDDTSDLQVMAAVGFPVAPADAIPEARAIAKHVTTRSGGHGAVREVSDLILQAQRGSEAPAKTGRMILVTGTGERTTAQTAAAAEETAYRLALIGETVLTNSGRNGVPEAAAKGVRQAKSEGAAGRSIAYAFMPDLTAETCGTDEIRYFDSFENRNGCICRDAEIAIFFQGGFGTLAKLFTLLQRSTHINDLLKGRDLPRLVRPKQIILHESFAKTPSDLAKIMGSTIGDRHLAALKFAGTPAEIVAAIV